MTMEYSDTVVTVRKEVGADGVMIYVPECCRNRYTSVEACRVSHAVGCPRRR
jgi:hypothetical protein